MWLSNEAFRTVVASTPLVSIDLVIRDARDNILLGQRLNRPAQGYWFVPGGRVLKDETLDRAFERLTLHELGRTFSRAQARLLGIYEHFYRDNVFGGSATGPSTHYVVMGYQLTLASGQGLAPPLAQQHGQYRWWSVEEMQSPAVHENTRAYLDALN